MTKILWRVEWNLARQDTRCSLEFTSEDKAMKWTDGLSKGGASEVVVTELIVGRTMRLDSDTNLFSEK